MTTVLNALKQHKWPVTAAVLIFLAYAFGRWGTPPRTVVQQHTDTQESQRLQVQVDTLTKSLQTWQQTIDQHLAELSRERTADRDQRRTYVEVRPDGTRISDTVETTSHTDSKSDSKTADVHAAAAGAAATVAATHETEDAATSRRQVTDLKVTQSGSADHRLLLGLGLGVSVPGLLGGTADRQLIPFLPKVVLGQVSLDYRLFGPFYTGLWATSSGAVGLHLGVGLR